MSQQPKSAAEQWRELAQMVDAGQVSTAVIPPELVTYAQGEITYLRAQVSRLQAGGGEWREVLEAVMHELPTRDSNDGNAPGHGHSTAGIWDSDSGVIAGKPCAWCLTWNKAKRLVATLQPVAAAPALVPLTDSWAISTLGSSMANACETEGGTPLGPVTNLMMLAGAKALIAEFCRINGLTVGDGRVG